MALTQTHGGQHWTEPLGSGVAGPASAMVIRDDGTQYVFAFGTADYRAMDVGDGQFTLVAVGSVVPADPELLFVSLGSETILGYQ